MVSQADHLADHTQALLGVVSGETGRGGDTVSGGVQELWRCVTEKYDLLGSDSLVFFLMSMTFKCLVSQSCSSAFVS